MSLISCRQLVGCGTGGSESHAELPRRYSGQLTQCRCDRSGLLSGD
ncbi:hypothetical protein ACFPRL_02885 [Pseudoclavibacter helvolus]